MYIHIMCKLVMIVCMSSLYMNTSWTSEFQIWYFEIQIRTVRIITKIWQNSNKRRNIIHEY